VKRHNPVGAGPSYDGHRLTLTARGKVRDIYAAGPRHLVLVASDRISAFDVVMDEPVPDKGRILTAISAFWFELLDEPNHLVSTDVADITGAPDDWAGRIMIVRRAEMLPIECIVRGHLSGSAWQEYRATGTVHGEAMPTGLQQSARLAEPIFTPSTKAAVGIHDENISYGRAVELVGVELASAARALSLRLFAAGATWAAARGIVVADTKFELGMVDGVLVVADEILTPDSSRFWPSDSVVVGQSPPSFDKQPLRDWLDSTGWSKTPPPPTLPAAVVAATRARYVEAYERLTGSSIDRWMAGRP
jgi:phosphoribosylaminoimidazole-succinocarboxamide synthase